MRMVPGAPLLEVSLHAGRREEHTSGLVVRVAVLVGQAVGTLVKSNQLQGFARQSVGVVQILHAT